MKSTDFFAFQNLQVKTFEYSCYVSYACVKIMKTKKQKK